MQKSRIRSGRNPGRKQYNLKRALCAARRSWRRELCRWSVKQDTSKSRGRTALGYRSGRRRQRPTAPDLAKLGWLPNYIAWKIDVRRRFIFSRFHTLLLPPRIECVRNIIPAPDNGVKFKLSRVHCKNWHVEGPAATFFYSASARRVIAARQPCRGRI